MKSISLIFRINSAPGLKSLHGSSHQPYNLGLEVNACPTIRRSGQYRDLESVIIQHCIL